MKKHILQENYERMFGSIKEDWWDDMSSENRAQYIKDHPGSKQAQNAADDEADDMDRDARFAADAEDEPSGEDMSDEELGAAAQQASDEYDIARQKADDVAMRTGNTDSDEHKAAEAAYAKVTDLENKMKKRKASTQAVSALGSDGSDEQAENLYQLIKTPEDRDDPVLGQEHEVESDDGEYTYDSPGWEIVQNIARKARDSEDPAATFKKEFENAPPEVQEYILANIGKGKAESIKVINGKKYRAIRESVNKRISVKEVHKWLKGLEEYRYRKIPGVDARRITSFVNNGLSETDLPASLQKKWGNAKYSREKHLADKFVKERISRKLARNESNHPLKEQYNKLFKNKVVL